MRLILQLVAVAAIAFGGSLAVNAVDGTWPLTLVLGLATAVLTALVYRWVVGRTERRQVVELSAGGAVGGLTRGVLVGVALFAAVIANIAFLGDYHVAGKGSVTAALATVGFMAAAAVTEELMFRGVLFRIVEGWVGTGIALVLSALVFGALHLPNPHATLWSALAIAVEAGGMLAAAYAATRKLWVPIGLHFGWNFAEGGIFGTEVSGKTGSTGLLKGTLSGPDLVSGGSFGPEASLYALGAGILVTAVFLVIAHKRGNLVPLRKSRRTGAHADLSVPAATLGR
jgi:uncharacterized protein